MKRFFVNYGYVIWIGFSLAVVGISVTSWHFYFILFPTVYAVEYYKDHGTQ